MSNNSLSTKILASLRENPEGLTERKLNDYYFQFQAEKREQLKKTLESMVKSGKLVRAGEYDAGYAVPQKVNLRPKEPKPQNQK